MRPVHPGSERLRWQSRETRGAPARNMQRPHCARGGCSLESGLAKLAAGFGNPGAIMNMGGTPRTTAHTAPHGYTTMPYQ